MNITFSHTGNIGDILFSLYFCKEFTIINKQDKFNFNIQINVEDPALKMLNHPFGTVRMTSESANFIKSLLESQEYINEVSISNDIPANAINLDLFRKLPCNFMAGDIRSWYYNLSKQHLPREFWKPIITSSTDDKYKDKILVISTERYQNVFIDYKQLKQFKNHLIFIGTEKEHNLFNDKYFNIEYKKCSSLLEIAKYMSGAKGVLGNQSGLYSLAECMKVKRILISAEYFMFNNKIVPGPVNNHPIRWLE